MCSQQFSPLPEDRSGSRGEDQAERLLPLPLVRVLKFSLAAFALVTAFVCLVNVGLTSSKVEAVGLEVFGLLCGAISIGAIARSIFRKRDRSRNVATQGLASPPLTVSTYCLFAYLMTVLAWIGEIGVLVVEGFGRGTMGAAVHITVLTFSCLLTVVSWILGKEDFRRLRHTRGRIALTRAQAWLIGGFVVALSVLASTIMTIVEG